MKRLLLTLIALSLCAGMLVYTLPVEAGKSYSNNSLYGTWYYVATEVRWDGEQCNNYGTIEFYNDAGEDVAETEEWFRCVGPSPTYTVTTGPHSTDFTYEVDADGHFTLTTDPGGEETHCKILNNGKLVLCDGTLAPAPVSVDKGAISYFATAVKE